MSRHAVVHAIDAQLTESFLLSMPEVMDASVWFHGGQMMAHVTLEEDCDMRPREFQRACMECLGLHQTPRQVLLLLNRRPAA